MRFNDHSQLVGQHAFLSASKYHWVNYNAEKLDLAFSRWQASVRGTRLHALAHEMIEMGVRLPKTNKTLNLYVNDAIGFKMHTEVVLYYSENCFGTADTIAFRNKVLRIHDYKSGISAASITQLMIYAALFCLEYNVKPIDIEIELRIYQSDEVSVYTPASEEIYNIMDKIVEADKRIDQLKNGG